MIIIMHVQHNIIHNLHTIILEAILITYCCGCMLCWNIHLDDALKVMYSGLNLIALLLIHTICRLAPCDY